MTLDEIKELTGYALAQMAGVSSPDSQESPGAVFLTDVRDWYIEHRDDIRADEDKINQVGQMDTSAGAVDHRTYQAWCAFTDLAIWQNNDLDQFENSWKWEDISDAIYFGLGETAESLARLIYEDDTEIQADEDEDEDNE